VFGIAKIKQLIFIAKFDAKHCFNPVFLTHHGKLVVGRSIVDIGQGQFPNTQTMGFS